MCVCAMGGNHRMGKTVKLVITSPMSPAAAPVVL